MNLTELRATVRMYDGKCTWKCSQHDFFEKAQVSSTITPGEDVVAYLPYTKGMNGIVQTAWMIQLSRDGLRQQMDMSASTVRTHARKFEIRRAYFSNQDDSSFGIPSSDRPLIRVGMTKVRQSSAANDDNEVLVPKGGMNWHELAEHFGKDVSAAGKLSAFVKIKLKCRSDPDRRSRCFAAFVAEDCCIFFDPEVGEFQLPNIRMLGRWLALYMQRAGYFAEELGFDQYIFSYWNVQGRLQRSAWRCAIL